MDSLGGHWGQFDLVMYSGRGYGSLRSRIVFFGGIAALACSPQ